MESDQKPATADVKPVRPRGRPKGSTKAVKDPTDRQKDGPLT